MVKFSLVKYLLCKKASSPYTWYSYTYKNTMNSVKKNTYRFQHFYFSCPPPPRQNTYQGYKTSGILVPLADINLKHLPLNCIILFMYVTNIYMYTLIITFKWGHVFPAYQEYGKTSKIHKTSDFKTSLHSASMTTCQDDGTSRMFNDLFWSCFRTGSF